MITVTIYAEDEVTATVKRRAGWSGTAIRTVTAVNVGNFGSSDLFADNSIELGLGQMAPPIGTWEDAYGGNYIKLTWGSYNVIGFITNWEYINEANARIHYQVDSFSSAQESNMIQRIEGLCNRTHLDYNDAQSLINQNPDEFSPSDICRPDHLTTQNLNAITSAFEGLDPSPDNLADGNIAFILTVSPAVVAYMGTIGIGYAPMANATGDTGFTQQLSNVNSFNFRRCDTTVHSGGIYRGLPLVFNTIGACTAFINRLMGGCGFRLTMPTTGYSNHNINEFHQYQTPDNNAGGSVTWQSRAGSGNDRGFEAVRFITSQDIYNFYAIPINFAVPTQATILSTGHTIPNVINLSNLHNIGAENNDKSKLLMYPYAYTMVSTANGDELNLLPQQYHDRGGFWENTSELKFDLKYVGGDMPRLMARFAVFGTAGSPWGNTSLPEWITVRNYPALTLSMSDSESPQAAMEIMQSRKLEAMHANKVNQFHYGNAFAASIRDGFVDNPNRSGVGNLMGRVGDAIGQGTMISQRTANQILGRRSFDWAFRNNEEQEIQLAANIMNATNMVSAVKHYISGNGFAAQMAVPAFAAYRAGATDSELHSFARYIDLFGNVCSDIIDPIANSGTLYGGNADFSEFNGRSFYRFSWIDVDGTMPEIWKRNIKGLFENGVYLIN